MLGAGSVPTPSTMGAGSSGVSQSGGPGTVRHFGAMARAPWTAVPAARSSASVLKIRLWLVLGTLLACAALGLFSGLAWISGSTGTSSAPAQPAATGFATTIAGDYVAGRTTVLPVAAGLSQNLGLTRVAGASGPALDVTMLAPEGVTFTMPATTGGRYLETHHYLVETTGTPPVLYNLAVVVDITHPQPVLAAYPTLSPKSFTGSAAALDYGGGPSTQWATALPASVTTAVNQWATAFIKNDQAGLQQLVGDPSAAVGAFRGLRGMTPASATPATVVGGYTGSLGADVLHVSLAMTPSGANGITMSSDYDLLVNSPGTTTPKVVAWGPPGSGPTLVAYQNNVNGAGSGS